MGRTNPAVLLGFFVAVIAAMSVAATLQGGLYVAKHEGDTLHMTQIALRMAMGQVPHADFMTPIGAFAFLPIVYWLGQGWGIGMSFLLGQVMVAVLILPALWWVAASRFRGWAAYLFGVLVLVLVLGLVHGEAQRNVSVSMHYNRWAWAVAFLALATVLLKGPAGRGAALADGLVIGLAMAVLALIKLTYFVAFAPVVLIGLLLRRQFAALGIAVLAGLVVAGAVTLAYGMAFWVEYVRDIIEVATSSVRPAPGEPLEVIVGAPAYLAGSLTLLLAVILLRHAKYQTEGLLLLLLVPGFFYVTYQNFGNDPQWLMFLAPVLLTLRPAEAELSPWGWDLRTAFAVAAAVTMALIAPSALNMGYSAFRHAALDPSGYAPMLPRSEVHDDLFAAGTRAYRPTTKTTLEGPETPFAAYAEISEWEPQPTFLGEVLPDCEMMGGMVAWFDVVTRDLEAAGYGGSGILGADVFSSYWLYGDFRPLKNGTPWHYAGLPGLEDADYFLVPTCPVAGGARKAVIAEMNARLADGFKLTEVRRTPLYILYAPG